MKKKILYIGNQLQHSGLTPTTIDTLAPKLIDEGFEVVTFSKKEGFASRMWDMVMGLLKNTDADFVLIDTYSTKAFWFCFVISQLCRLLNLRYIPYLHGGNLPQRLDANPYISKFIFNNSYINVAPSGFLKHEFEKRNFKNTTFIPNYIEIVNYSYKELKSDKPLILWVRSFAQLYNPKLAIDILVKLKDKYPQAELCMVGPEKDGSLEQTKEYALHKNVEVSFPGKLEKKDWIKLSEKYNIFLNTTNFDNTPVSVMEAMALGLPIVSSNVGGVPYLIEHGVDGYLTNPNDAEAMVNIIDALIKSPEMYSSTIKNARLKALTWDWDQVKIKWNSLFDR